MASAARVPKHAAVHLEALLSRYTAPLGVDREALSNYLDTMCREPLVEMATTCVATHSRFHGTGGLRPSRALSAPRAAAIR